MLPVGFEWYIWLPALLGLLYWHGTRTFSHWKIRGVKHIPPVFFFGNIRDRVLFRRSFHEVHRDFYFAFPSERIAGTYEGRRPVLMIRDPELIRQVLVRDFNHFVDRPVLQFRQSPTITKMLISLQGSEWKAVRSILTPAFSSGKMKAMAILVEQVGQQMDVFLQKQADSYGGSDMEMKDFFGRFTLDVIASCAFGVQCDSLHTPDAKFVARASKFSDLPVHERICLFFVLLFVPFLARFLPLSFMNRHVLHFLEDVVRETKEERIKSGVRRNDFLQLLLDAHEAEETKHTTDPVLTEDTMIAQAILFLLAGFETSSTVLTFAAYELALNPDVQSRLRTEINDILYKHDGQCTYDALQEMDYLDMVIFETMRKHPPVARVDRICTSSYTIPDTSLRIERGQALAIPVMGLHYDPQYFPDPMHFDPMRFSSEEKTKRSPYVYLPFGAGPRNCIGSRFAMMSVKIALVHLVKGFDLKPCAKTEVPYAYSAFSMFLKAKNGVWINVKKLDPVGLQK